MKEILKTILYKPLFNVLILLVFLIPGHNVGIAIILLTILVRIVLLPSSLNASRQQKRMQDLQPEIKALQDKYKDDKQKQSEALLAFYKENKVNPLGSCLPLLIQLPILIVLYYVFINGLNMDRFGDLLYSFTPRPDFINTNFLGIDLAKPDRYILPIIAAVLQYFQAKQTMPKLPKKVEGEEEDKSIAIQNMVSQQMVILMPVMTLLIAGRFPAALPLYWIVTTLFAIAQQWWVNKEGSSKVQSKKLKANNTVVKHGVEVTVRKKGE